MAHLKDETSIYVGGLHESIGKETLHAAFIPFGDIIHISLPIDPSLEKHRGFGFIEFEDSKDAEHAIQNMHRAELFGKVLTVNRSRGTQSHTDKYKAVWVNTDEYVKELEKDSFKKRMEDKKQKQKILQRARELAERPSGPHIRAVTRKPTNK